MSFLTRACAMTERHDAMWPAQMAAALISLLLVLPTSFACFISPESKIRQSPRHAFDQAQEVFIAKPLSIEMIDDYLVRITFDVSAVLKGSNQRLRTITQNRGLGCEFTPGLGLEALIFMSPHGDAYSIRSVGGSSINEVLAELPAPVWRAAD
jgi:hypothetical protein